MKIFSGKTQHPFPKLKIHLIFIAYVLFTERINSTVYNRLGTFNGAKGVIARSIHIIMPYTQFYTLNVSNARYESIFKDL